MSRNVEIAFFSFGDIYVVEIVHKAKVVSGVGYHISVNHHIIGFEELFEVVLEKEEN